MINGQAPGNYMPRYAARAPTTNNPTIQAATGANGGQQHGPAASMAGMDIQAAPEHLDALRETESNTIGCVPDYRNRMKHIIRFWKDHYPTYHDEVVFSLSPEQRRDKRRYWTAKHDLRYSRLNPELTKIYMSGQVKTKADGKQYSYDHVRKYHDAILYGAKLAKEDLPPGYASQMKTFLKTLKKEKANARSNGNVEEKEADAIPWTLFEAMCRWALTLGNVMVWTFTIIQWNIMGRSINVDPLGFHNLSRSGGNDSIVIKYDTNKKDAAGEHTSPKNCYANPKNPTVCMFLALGCYLCVNRDKYDRMSDKTFQKMDNDRSAAQSYYKALQKMVASLQ